MICRTEALCSRLLRVEMLWDLKTFQSDSGLTVLLTKHEKGLFDSALLWHSVDCTSLELGLGGGGEAPQVSPVQALSRAGPRKGLAHTPWPKLQGSTSQRSS